MLNRQRKRPTHCKLRDAKPDLQELVIGIYTICHSHDIVIVPKWLPRVENKISDKISKFVDYDDWSIDDYAFATIDLAWGTQ